MMMPRTFVREWTVRIAAVVFLLGMAAPRLSASDDGKRITPENFRAAAEYSAANGGLSLLVVQSGRVVFESFAKSHGPTKARKIYSGTKAFWTVAACAAVEDGILRLDERASDTLNEWRGNSNKQRVTLRELLSFTAGLDPGFRLHRDGIADLNRIALGLPLVAPPPGSRFIYGPSQLQIFCEVLRRKLALRNETPWSYMERRVLLPLGLRNLKYRHDETGTPLLATGFELTASQWARFGQMVLGKGTYRGHKILEPSSLDSCLRGTFANPGFGLAFWLNSRAADAGAREFDIENMLEKDWQNQNWCGTCVCTSAPTDMVACIGSRGQRLFVLPSLDTVVVRQGAGGDAFRDGRFLRILLGR